MAVRKGGDFISFLQNGALETRLGAMVSDPAATAHLAQELAEGSDLIALTQRLAVSSVPLLIANALNWKEPGQQLLEAVCRSPVTIDLARVLLLGDAAAMKFGDANAARRLGPRSVGHHFAMEILATDAAAKLVSFAAGDGPMASVELESSLLGKNEQLFTFADNAFGLLEPLARTDAGQRLSARLVDENVPGRMRSQARGYPERAARNHASDAFARACLMASSYVAVSTSVVLVAAHAGVSGTAAKAGDLVEFLSGAKRAAKIQQLEAAPAATLDLATRVATQPSTSRLARRLNALGGSPNEVALAMTTGEDGHRLIEQLAVSESGHHLVAYVVTDPDAQGLAGRLTPILDSIESTIAGLDSAAKLARQLAHSGSAPSVLAAHTQVRRSFYLNATDVGVPLRSMGDVASLVERVNYLVGGGAIQPLTDENGELWKLFVDTREFAAFVGRLGDPLTLENHVRQLSVASEPYDLAHALVQSDAGLDLALELIESSNGREFCHLVATSAPSVELVAALAATEAAKTLRSRRGESDAALSAEEAELLGAALAMAALTLGPALIGGWFVRAASYSAVVATTLLIFAAWLEPSESTTRTHE